MDAPCKRFIVRGYAAGLVPTSTTGGQHASGSFHKQKDAAGRGRAVDLGLRDEHVAGRRLCARNSSTTTTCTARSARTLDEPE
jgi:hypothetical protein